MDYIRIDKTSLIEWLLSTYNQGFQDAQEVLASITPKGIDREEVEKILNNWNETQKETSETSS